MQKPFSVLYEVFETNTRLEKLRIRWIGYHRDMAETFMNRLAAANTEKDFMLRNANTEKIEVVAFGEARMKLFKR
jgi:hypothetical protein